MKAALLWPFSPLPSPPFPAKWVPAHADCRNDHIAQGDYEGLKWIIAAFFASILVQYVSQYAQTLSHEIMGQHVMLDIRRDIFAHLQKLPLRYFDHTPLGRIMTRTTNDVEALNDFFSEGIVSVFIVLIPSWPSDLYDHHRC